MFKEGDPRTLPPRQSNGKQICAYEWHGERCPLGGPPSKGGTCRYEHGITKIQYENGEAGGGEALAASGDGGGGVPSGAGSQASSADASQAFEQRMHKLELASAETSAKLDQIIARMGGGAGGPSEEAGKQRRAHSRQAHAASDVPSSKASKQSRQPVNWAESSTDEDAEGRN